MLPFLAPSSSQATLSLQFKQTPQALWTSVRDSRTSTQCLHGAQNRRSRDGPSCHGISTANQSSSPVQRLPSLQRACRCCCASAALVRRLKKSHGGHALLLIRRTSLLKPPQMQYVLYRMSSIYSTSVEIIMGTCFRYSQAFLHSRHASLSLVPPCGPSDIPLCGICARWSRSDKTETAC